MQEFWNGLLSGLVVEIIIGIVIYVVAKFKNSTILKILASSKIFGHGIEYVYKNQNYAMKDMVADIQATRKVKIFCMRGRSFIQSDAELSAMIERRDLDIQYLVLDPESYFVSKRSEELNKPNYKQELETNITDLVNQSVGKNNIHKKKHNQPPVFRILILDSRIYFSFFEENKLGSKIPIFRAKKNTAIYNGLNRYFNFIWDVSKEF